MRQDFGPWLKSEIKRLRLTQSEFAQRIGIEQPYLSRIISGDRNASIEILANISLVTKKPIDFILQKYGVMPERPENDQVTQEINYALQMLDREDVDEVLEIIRMKLEKKNNKKASRGKSPARSIIEQ